MLSEYPLKILVCTFSDHLPAQRNSHSLILCKLWAGEGLLSEFVRLNPWPVNIRLLGQSAVLIHSSSRPCTRSHRSRYAFAMTMTSSMAQPQASAFLPTNQYDISSSVRVAKRGKKQIVWEPPDNASHEGSYKAF